MDTKSIGIRQNSIHRSDDLSRSEADKISDQAELKESFKPNKNFNVNLSKEAQELLQARQNAMSIAKSTSPIREDKIADIKARIDAGTYKVDAGKIADGMLMEAIKDKVSTGSEV